MELFEKDERYRNFHLDGQTIVLDDYLEIRPENREKLKNMCRKAVSMWAPGTSFRMSS